LIIKQILKRKKALSVTMTVLATVNLLLTSVCGFPLASLAAGENKSVTPATNENTSTNTVGTNSALTNGVSQKDSAPYTLTPKENGVQEMLLANGLKVLLLEEHAFPVVTSMVVYRVGSRNENLGETGLSHLVEHLLFEKVGRFRKGELGATIARNGGMFNGFTSDDFTVFFETLSPAKLPMALRIEADRMHSATFSAEDVQAEIKRIEKELDTEAKDAANLLNKEVRSAAFQLHPYKNPTIGWRSDVQKLTLDDVKRHYRDYYQPANATLVIVGDFNAKTQAAQVQKYFGAIAKGEPPRAVRVVEPAQKAERRVYMKYGGNSDVVAMAYHTTNVQDADAAALAVLEKLLVSGVSGRLKTKLVDSKICSNVRCTFEAKRDPGLFTINLASTPGTNSQKVIESCQSVLEQLRTTLVPEAELKRARNHAEFHVLAERDGPYRTAFHLAYAESIESWPAAFAWFTKVRAVSSSDVQRVAKRYFNQENRVLGVLSGAANKSATAKKDVNAKDGNAKDVNAKDGKDNKDSKDSASGKSNKDSKDGKSDSKFDSKKNSTKNKSDVDKSKKPSKNGARHKTAWAEQRLPFGLSGCAYKNDDETVGDLTLRGGRPLQVAQSAATSPATVSAPGAAKVPLAEITANPNIKKAVLKNGLTLAVLETKLSPAVQIIGAVKAGEAYEPVGKRGVSAVLAQAMADGSPKYPHQLAVTVQDELGIAPNAMVRFDAGPQWISFQTRCLARDTSTMLGILASQLHDPLTKDADVEHAKQVVVERVKHTEDTVKARVKRALMQGLIAPNTSFYPLEPMDKARFVGALKASDVLDFHSQAIRPDATTIVFVGDISLSQAVELTERSFASWTGKSTAKKVLVQANPRRMLKSSMTIDKRQDTMVTIGRLVDTGLGRPDYPLLLLSDCALTSHPIFSRFAQKISGELGLSSSMSLEDLASDVESLPGTTVWSIDMPLVSNLMPVAVRSIQQELKKFGRAGLTAEEYSEVRLYLNGALPVRWMANSQLAAHSILDSVVLDGACDPLPLVQQGIRSSTLDSLNRFVRTTFKPDRATLVIAGTKQAIGQVHGLRQDEGGTESGASGVNNSGAAGH
jgi:zinc protease